MRNKREREADEEGLKRHSIPSLVYFRVFANQNLPSTDPGWCNNKITGK